jgi:hypothetical protein
MQHCTICERTKKKGIIDERMPGDCAPRCGSWRPTARPPRPPPPRPRRGRSTTSSSTAPSPSPASGPLTSFHHRPQAFISPVMATDSNHSTHRSQATWLSVLLKSQTNDKAMTSQRSSDQNPSGTTLVLVHPVPQRAQSVLPPNKSSPRAQACIAPLPLPAQPNPEADPLVCSAGASPATR